MNKLKITALLSAMVLSGCGGSGGSTGSGGTTKVDPPALQVRGDLSPALNQSVALVATYDTDMSDKATITWTKKSGPELELVATNSAVLAFDVINPGSYEFTVSYTGSDNKARTKDISFTTGTSTKILNVRRDHAVREKNKVSLKLSAPVDPQTLDVVDGVYTNVVWQQTSGPTVTLDAKNTNERIAIFKAPSVAKDQLITFSVSATHPNGQTYSDKAYVLVQNTVGIASNAIFDEVVAKVSAYNQKSPHAESLEKCIYANYFTTPCSIDSVNLIGQDYDNPTVDQIMDRVVVSHQWMGDNFRLFLENEDVNGDFKKLLRSVSAIVISYDIRPSFYWVATGAMYLDPEDLWLTPTQRDVIDIAPDYRGEFGQDLQYIMPWRYVKDNDYASSYYAKELRFNRSTSDIVPDLASLLYHELAHANDIFPANSFAGISGATVYGEYQKRKGNTIAELLTATHPKHSDEMAALGQVNFRGAKVSAQQIAYLPQDIVDFFSNDSAPTEYAYSSIQEDVATLFDATMMSARYGIERDEAITPPYDPSVGSESLALAWGQRGRIKDPLVEPRAKFVLERIMPALNATEILASLPEVTVLPVGVKWSCAGIVSDKCNDKSVSRVQGLSKSSSRYQRPVELDWQRKYK